MKAKIIGVCGRSGSGKTTVCAEFSKYGIEFIDTDAVYGKLVTPKDGVPSPLLVKIAKEFGEKVISDDGNLNRKYLGEIVFSDKEKLNLLNKITHGCIIEESLNIADGYIKDGATAVLLDAPALFESGADKYCDEVLLITAPEDVLIYRIMKRDGVDEESAKKRLASQPSESELRKKCKYVIVNGKNCDVSSQVKIVADSIRRLS